MPRYFFYRTDGGFSPDPEGTELGDIHEARIEAVAYAAETLRDRPDVVWIGHDLKVQVFGEGERLLFTVMISVQGSS